GCARTVGPAFGSCVALDGRAGRKAMTMPAPSESSAIRRGNDQPYDVERVRADFPIFRQTVYGKPLTFLDSAASPQKPQAVLDAIHNVYANDYANIHRGVYYLSQKTTQAFEDA